MTTSTALNISGFTFIYFGIDESAPLAPEEQPTTCKYRVFTGNSAFAAKGNACVLAFDDTPAQQQHSTTTRCHSHYADGNVQVHCQQNGQLIQCCGHGLVAAAHYWLTTTGQTQLQLTMNGSNLQASREDNIIWLQFSAIALTPQPKPAWLATVFPQHYRHCLAAASTAAEDGYWVLQWPLEVLKALPTAHQGLAQHTQRALINTSEINRNTVALRYFAPQYGNAEDTATGSAMRVLASYWQRPTLTAHQLSPLGGLLYARYQKEHTVWVGGECQRQPHTPQGLPHE